VSNGSSGSSNGSVRGASNGSSPGAANGSTGGGQRNGRPATSTKRGRRR
jgi:hypothetical protein